MEITKEKLAIVSILGLNILIGLVHAVTHVLDDHMLNTTFDFVFPILTQIVIPLLAMYLFHTTDYKRNFKLNITLTLNFILIFIYSTYYHFFSQTIDNIRHASSTLSGYTFLLTAYSLFILNFLGIILFLILSYNDRKSKRRDYFRRIISLFEAT